MNLAALIDLATHAERDASNILPIISVPDYINEISIAQKSKIESACKEMLLKSEVVKSDITECLFSRLTRKAIEELDAIVAQSKVDSSVNKYETLPQLDPLGFFVSYEGTTGPENQDGLPGDYGRILTK